MAAFALVLSAMAAPTAQALTVNAFVVRQSCVNGDIVQVTLSATVQPHVQVRYRWDFNNDGIFDTGLLMRRLFVRRIATYVVGDLMRRLSVLPARLMPT